MQPIETAARLQTESALGRLRPAKESAVHVAAETHEVQPFSRGPRVLTVICYDPFMPQKWSVLIILIIYKWRFLAGKVIESN